MGKQSRRAPWVAGAIAATWSSLSGSAEAQLGSGWNAYDPPERVQTRGCATHASEAGLQRFALTCDAASGDNRAEQRIENDYSSGTNQFEGEVRVVSLGGMNVSLKQTFMPNNGAFLMIAVAGDGRLYSVGDGAPGELATGIIGRWVRINTIHDVSAGTHEIHIDGVLKFTKRGGRQVAWHDKYGTYRLGSGRGPIVAEWRNVKYWRGGRSGGGAPPPPSPADAGERDTSIGGIEPAPDAAVAADTAAPGGAGGSGGAAGAGGAAGWSGRDAAPTTEEVDPAPAEPAVRPASRTTGCQVSGGGRTRESSLALAAGCLVWMAARACRRRPRSPRRC
jgi:hypothetical protein